MIALITAREVRPSVTTAGERVVAYRRNESDQWHHTPYTSIYWRADTCVWVIMLSDA